MTKKIILGSMESDAPGDIVTLSANVGAAHYSTLQTTRGASGASAGGGYQVPTGYELIITNLYLRGTPAGTSAVVGYGNTIVDDAASPPTSAVGLSSANLLSVTTAAVIERVPVCLVIPAGKYPYLYSAGTLEVMASGFLHRT